MSISRRGFLKALAGVGITATIAPNLLLAQDKKAVCPTTKIIVPKGYILPFINTFKAKYYINTEHGWLLCDGRALSKKHYRELYSAIENDYGESSTMFNIPDLRGYFRM